MHPLQSGVFVSLTDEVRRLTEADGRGIATWRYPDRYSTYDVGEVVTAADGYWAVVGEEEELVGYCCFGQEARVPGVDEEHGTLDIGYGCALTPSAMASVESS